MNFRRRYPTRYHRYPSLHHPTKKTSEPVTPSSSAPQPTISSSKSLNATVGPGGTTTSTSVLHPKNGDSLEPLTAHHRVPTRGLRRLCLAGREGVERGWGVVGEDLVGTCWRCWCWRCDGVCGNDGELWAGDACGISRMEVRCFGRCIVMMGDPTQNIYRFLDSRTGNHAGSLIRHPSTPTPRPPPPAPTLEAYTPFTTKPRPPIPRPCRHIHTDKPLPQLTPQPPHTSISRHLGTRDRTLETP
ncbi:hypothetical protein BC829DRAFT_178690 [Chytridium lagenaria]|nr:hypothetical protein BC829DRAFT_178690 [Chytridium lagenaria]